MNKQQARSIQNAIATFTKYKSEIDGLTDESSNTWVSLVADSVKLLIGSDTSLYKTIKNFQFYKITFVSVPHQSNSFWGKGGIRLSRTRHFNLHGEKNEAKKILDSCIEYINNHGTLETINQPEFSKFIRFISKWYYTSAAIAGIIGISFGIGYYFGNQKIDADKISLTKNVEELKNNNKVLEETKSQLLKRMKENQKAVH